MSMKFRAEVKIVWKFKCISHICTSDRLDFIETQLLARRRFDEPVAKQTHRTLTDREQYFLFVFEVDVDKGTREARTAGDLVDRHQIPSFFGVERLGRIQDLGAPSLFFLYSTLRDV